MILPAADITVNEDDVITLICDTKCVREHTVTLYRDETMFTAVETVAEFDVNGSFNIQLQRWHNGARYYCDIERRPNARSNTTTVTVHCEY